MTSVLSFKAKFRIFSHENGAAQPMIDDSLPTPAPLQRPARRFGFGRRVAGDGGNKIGLRPVEGWQKRNMDFLNQVLIPTILAPRKPGCHYGDLPVAAAEDIGVTWLGHAGFFAQVGGVNIAIDPVWALWLGPAKRLRHPSVWAHDLPPIDVVLITHAHHDHLHLASLRKLAAAQPIIVPEGVGSLVKNCGFGRIVELKTWQSATFADLRITLTPARHWGARMIHDTHRGFGGFLVPMHFETYPLSGEPLHEPIERLEIAAKERQIIDRVRRLREGESAVFSPP